MNLLDQLQHIDKLLALQILNKVAEVRVPVQLKINNSEKIITTKLLKIGSRKSFYIEKSNPVMDDKTEITVKILFQNRLYFLKTALKQNVDSNYFDSCDHLYELMRRKKPRFEVPARWTQTAQVHTAQASYDLKSEARVIEISNAGIKLEVRADLPRYEKDQIVKLRFKIHRRAEISLKGRIMHVQKNKSGGLRVGVEFIFESELTKNKVLNVCDDLAFYHAVEQPKP